MQHHHHIVGAQHVGVLFLLVKFDAEQVSLLGKVITYIITFHSRRGGNKPFLIFPHILYR